MDYIKYCEKLQVEILKNRFKAKPKRYDFGVDENNFDKHIVIDGCMIFVIQADLYYLDDKCFGRQPIKTKPLFKAEYELEKITDTGMIKNVDNLTIKKLEFKNGSNVYVNSKYFDLFEYDYIMGIDEKSPIQFYFRNKCIGLLLPIKVIEKW